MLEQQLSSALAALKRRLYTEASRITSTCGHDMTAGEFLLRFNGDVNSVGEIKKQQQLRARVYEQTTDIAEEIQQTVKKRFVMYMQSIVLAQVLISLQEANAD